MNDKKYSRMKGFWNKAKSLKLVLCKKAITMRKGKLIMRKNKDKEVYRGRKNLSTKETIFLTGMCFLPAAFIFVFKYLPIFGIILAFKDFRYNKGIWGSDWSGLKNFDFIFKSGTLGRLVRNTVGLNALFIVTGMVFAVAVAIILYEIKSRRALKTYQTLILLPYFISWVIASYIVYAILNPGYGLLNGLLVSLGFDKINWYGDPGYWPWILMICNIWKTFGYSSIVYYAALVGVDSSYFEAARLDGATKLQLVRYIILPFLMPVITIQFILAVGGIMRADFGMFYQVTRDVGSLYPVTDVLDTYAYRTLTEQSAIGMSSAVSFVQSVVGCILVLLTNWIVNRIEPDNALI